MNLPKELTTVTPFSKYLAMFLFILFPFFGFYLGMEYQRRLDVSNQLTKSYTDTLIGLQNPQMLLKIEIFLQPRHKPSLNYVTDPKSGLAVLPSNYQKSMYGITDEDINAVKSWLQKQDLTVQSVSLNNLSISVVGTTAQIEKTFEIQINDYRRPNGTTYYENNQAPTYPSNLRIQDILGLDNKAIVQPGY